MSERNKHDHDHAACIELFAKLSDYLDNELDAVTCKDIEAHLANCPCCSVCMETLKRTVAFCRKAEERPVPETLSKRLREIVAGLVTPESS
ncbi:MAG: zf-HC2 domain-containing protein [Desulfosarcinaceae bacterium]|jgi:RNA polymerase sigma-70 factor (ECF subfamily)